MNKLDVLRLTIWVKDESQLLHPSCNLILLALKALLSLMSLPLCLCACAQGGLHAPGRPGPSDGGVFWERADERSPQHSGEHVQVGRERRL